MIEQEKRFKENCYTRYETSSNQPLEEYNDLVIGGYGSKQGFKEACDGDKLVVINGISFSGEPYMSIFQPLSLKSIKSENRNVGRLLLDYIQTIYIIANLQKSVLEGYRNLISLRSIIFQIKYFRS